MAYGSLMSSLILEMRHRQINGVLLRWSLFTWCPGFPSCRSARHDSDASSSMVIFDVIPDKLTCGLLHRYTEQKWSNEVWFVKWILILCHRACYPSFLRPFSTYKSHTYSQYEKGMNIYIFFPFIVLTNRELIGHWWERIHSKAWNLPAKIQPCLYNGSSELTNLDSLSCQPKKSGWGKPGDLWLWQLRRVLICPDADNQIHIHIYEAGAPVSCSCPSDIRPTLTISLPIYSIHNGNSYYGTNHPSSWWVSHSSICVHQ